MKTKSTARRSILAGCLVPLLLGGVPIVLAVGAAVAAQESSASKVTEGTFHHVSFETSDAFTIRATLGLPAGETTDRPAVVLIHQGGSDRTEWAPYTGDLVDAGYVTLAYDVRGHGKSDKVEDLHALFNDPNQAPLDLRAALDYVRGLEQVDADRVAVVGSSIGGNLACVAVALMDVKTAVFMSGKTSAVFNLAGEDELEMASVYYISSEEDQGGKRAEWAQELYEMTTEPRKVEIVKGSGAHGVRIFANNERVWGRVEEWLGETL